MNRLFRKEHFEPRGKIEWVIIDDIAPDRDDEPITPYVGSERFWTEAGFKLDKRHGSVGFVPKQFLTRQEKLLLGPELGL